MGDDYGRREPEWSRIVEYDERSVTEPATTLLSLLDLLGFTLPTPILELALVGADDLDAELGGG